MKAVISFLKQKWFIQSVGVIAICALIWFAGPLIGVVKTYPLESEFNRMIFILITVIAWAIYNVVMRARSDKIDQQLMKKMSTPEVDPKQAEIEEAQKEESNTLRLKFEDALQKLKQTQSKSRRDRQYLYELPWYVIIGAPGCGKTTLLVNSGLHFPLSKYMDVGDLKGVGGTRNCDWLFTDDAIFLDTAGRYTTQDSFQPVDVAAWRSFLDLIKKYRSRRPINGVLVTVSISDLLRKTDDERHKAAKDIRQRILELIEVLGVQFPIYALFSKCDLIAGFTDFFADLNPDERAQVWGTTFQEADAKQTNHHIGRFQNDFEDLLKRLNQRTLDRVHQERDIQRRNLILNFPRQMALIKPSIMDFLQRTFSASRFDKVLLLRGVYFTSGTQEGTPIDRVMGILARTYGLDEQSVPVFSGSGKSYFIYRLLKEVVFPEAEMSGVDPRVERRKRRLNNAAYASILVLAVCISAGWLLSFINNKGAINHVTEKIDAYQSLPKTADDWDTGVKNLYERLQMLKSAREVYEDPPAWTGFGLNQGNKINSQIDTTYNQMLKNRLVPVIKSRLVQRMRSGMYEDDTSDLYALLKVYLMLSLAPEERGKDLEVAVEVIGNDWDENFRQEPGQFREDYRNYTRDLLNLDLGRLSLDQSVIADVRARLNEDPMYIQIYNQLKTTFLPDQTYDFRLEDVLGRYGSHVFTTVNGQDIRTVKISGLYTYEGYHEIFDKQGVAFVKKALKENWVLNNPAAMEKSDFDELYDELQTVYFTDYITKWKDMLDNLTIKQPKNISQAKDLLYYLTRPETPLRPLLEAVEKNTSLTKKYSPSDPDRKEAGPSDPAKDQVRPVDLSGLPPQLRNVENTFQKLNDMVRSTGNATPPLDEAIMKLEELHDFLDKSDSERIILGNSKDGMQGGGDLISSTQRGFEELPEPLNQWLLSLTSSGREVTLGVTKSALNSLWKSEVLMPYLDTLSKRYPLYRSSPHDATMADFSRFFGPDGIIDRFFKKHIAPFVDTTKPVWQEIPIDDQTMGLSGGVMMQFQNAAKIRDAFFAGGMSSPSIQFELKPNDMIETAGEFRLNLEGQTTRYSHDRPRSKRFEWPGPDENTGVRLLFKAVDGRELGQLNEEGPWAWLRMLDKSVVQKNETAGSFYCYIQG